MPRFPRGWAWACSLLAVLPAAWLYVLAPAGPDGAIGGREGAFVAPRPEVMVLAPGEATPTGRIFREITSVDGAVRVPTGWIVLDARASRLHVLVEVSGPDGQGRPRLRLERSLGGEGDGPGELRAPWRLVRRGERLIVSSATGSRLDIFEGGGAWLRRLELRVPGCPALLRPEIVPTEAGPGLVVAGQCPSARGTAWVVAAVDPEAPDGAPVVLTRTMVEVGGVLNFGSLQTLTAWRGRAFEGSLGDGCLRSVDGALPPAVCYPDAPPVPLPDTTRSRLDRLLAEHGARLGVEFEVPTEIPAVAGVAWSPAGPVFEVLREEAPPVRDVLLEAGRLVRLPALGDRIDPAPDRLLVSTQEVDGTRLRSVPWSPEDR